MHEAIDQSAPVGFPVLAGDVFPRIIAHQALARVTGDKTCSVSSLRRSWC
jgi:hypothetical protein